MNFLNRQFGRLGNRMFQMAYIYNQFKLGEIADIFMQDEIYFQESTNEIKVLFGEGIGKDDRIAIHVRRGKNPSNPEEPAYSENSFYVNLCATDYYKRAIDYFKIGEKFLVFSDDIEFCKGYFQNKLHSFEFSEGKSEEEDLKLMASCKGIIMANSSFSWWAAYLGDANKKVIYPKAWFADGVQRVGFPKEWICV